MGSEPPIVKAIQSWYWDWEMPRSTREWVSCLCPFHGDSTPSASVSTKFNYFQCRACGMKGDVIGLIMRKEEVPFVEAKRRAEKFFDGSHVPVSPKPQGKSGRRVPSKPKFGRPRNRQASSGVR